MDSIQKIFESKQEVIDIPMGEYEGLLTINHTCLVNGHGATIWAKEGNALIVNSGKVTLNNLRIEITNSPEDSVALRIKSDTILNEIEVYGQEELGDNLSNWLLPRMIDFGIFASGVSNEFCRKIIVSSPCNIQNNVHGLDIMPQRLVQGDNLVLFKILSLADSTVLYGDIILKTDYGVNKRIYITGRAKFGAVEVHERRAADAAILSGNEFSESESNRRNEKEWTSVAVVKGQRLNLDSAKMIFVGFQGEANTIEIDPYAFLLYENRKVRQDRDLIFWGNTQGKSDGIYIDKKFDLDGITVWLGNIPKEVEKVVIYFAIYENESNSEVNFSLVRNPKAKIYVDDRVYIFPLELRKEKSINILEIYKYKGVWRMKLVGAGFSFGIKKVCEEYGVIVM